MREFKGSTKAGERIIEMYMRLDGYTLNDIYKSYSQEKYNAYKRCYEQYEQDYMDGLANGFRVGNANTFGFTAGWTLFDDFDNIRGYRVETKDNSYVVWLDM